MIQSASPPGIVQDVEVLSKIERSGHRLVRSKARPDVKIERTKLAVIKGQSAGVSNNASQ